MHPAPRDRRSTVNPLRWLTQLGPLQSWLVVMAVIVGLSMVGLRPLAWLVALAWLGYAAYTWFKPTLRRWLYRRRRY